MFYVYALKSTVKDWVYIGMTTNLTRRVQQHNKGFNKSTKPYRPFKLLFFEVFDTSLEARKREKFLKTTTGKRWVKKQFY